LKSEERGGDIECSPKAVYNCIGHRVIEKGISNKKVSGETYYGERDLMDDAHRNEKPMDMTALI
jgi:hypothetical protein